MASSVASKVLGKVAATSAVSALGTVPTGKVWRCRHIGAFNNSGGSTRFHVAWNRPGDSTGYPMWGVNPAASLAPYWWDGDFIAEAGDYFTVYVPSSGVTVPIVMTGSERTL